MNPMTITCAYCGGHDFQLVVANLRENTELRCVNHAEHVAKLGLREQRRQVAIDHGLNPDDLA